MTLEEKYNLLLARIKRWADLEVPRADIEATTKLDSLSNEGNYDDVFNDGQSSADAFHALECRDLLTEIGELSDERKH